MKYKKFILATALTLAALAISAVALQREQAALSDKLIRLHVVANSDSEEDQQIKLKVRDAILEVTEQRLSRSNDPETSLASGLADIQCAAQQCLLECGIDAMARVTLGPERLPTRVYSSFSLPAGVYKTLRVTIGAGEGQNWWCVVFPSICFSAAGDMEKAAVCAGFSQEEISLITEENSGYLIKFKLIELVQKLQEMLVGGR